MRSPFGLGSIAATNFVPLQLRRLVCFGVYHSGHGFDREVIQSAFAAIDKAFATELGISIQEEHDYEMETIVCKDWYDDGCWNLLADDEAS